MKKEELEKIIESQKQEIESLQRHVAWFSSMIEMSVILSSTFDLDELIRRVLGTSQRVMASEASNLMLLNEETGMLECKVALGKVGRKLQKSFTLKMGQGVAGWVAKHRKSLLVPDVTTDERFYAGIDKETGFTTRSILCSPLIVQKKVIGVAEVVNRTDGKSFTDEDLRLFETFCRGVSVAIQNAQMHRRLLNNQRVEQQLEMASAIQ
jgi:phosphoserine phosphatase RsbU/P